MEKLVEKLFEEPKESGSNSEMSTDLLMQEDIIIKTKVLTKSILEDAKNQRKE